jgi:autophagy-related protein 2
LKLIKDEDKAAKSKSKSSNVGLNPEEDVLPTIQEVAKEFLEAEPEEERQEIEAAIQSQSTANLEESTSETSEEELGLGAAFPVSAYGYIEGAIKGIIDRLELTIEDVTFVIHFDAPVDTNSEEEVESSLRFHLDELDVEGLTSRTSAHSQRGKRRIVLRQIRADVTSSSALFASLERISSFASQAPTQSSPAMSRGMRSPSPVSRMSPSGNESLAASGLGSDSIRASKSALRASALEPADDPSTPLDENRELFSSKHQSPGDRFADASDEEDEAHKFLVSSQLNFKNHVDTSTQEEAELFPFDMDVSGMQKSTVASNHRMGHPNTSLNHSARFGKGPAESVMKKSNFLEGLHLHTSSAPEPKNGSNSSSGSSSVGEDLSESRFFTHEEAQSMYESAMSHMERPEAPHSSGINPSIHLASAPKKHHQDRSSLQDEVACDTPTPRSPGLEAASAGPILQPGIRLSSPQRKESRKSVTKEVISIDEVSVLVPWTGHVQETYHDGETLSETSSNDQSTDYEMPGAFSYHKSKRPKDRSSQKATEKQISQAERPSKSLPELADVINDVQIAIGFLDGKLELSSGRILFALLQQILSSLHSLPESKAESMQTSSTHVSEPSVKSFGLSIGHLKLSIQEQLSHLLDLQQSDQGTPSSSSPQQDSILVLDLCGSEVSLCLDKQITTADLKVRQFLVGFPDQKIISFEASLQKSLSFKVGASSIIQPPLQHDILVKYQSTNDRGQELHIDTRRLLLDFNLPMIDEKLVSYGGLSGILDLSSSIVSNSTMLVPQEPKLSIQQQHDEQDEPEDSTASGKAPKVNVKIDGIKVIVHGKDCNVRLRTSTVKAVLRQDNITVRTGHVQFAGPTDTENPLILDILDPELSFFFIPREEDLSLLLSLINPSRDPYEDEGDILLDTLVRQRIKGSLIRGTIRHIDFKLHNLEALRQLQSLSSELSKFQNVAKYLPDDERPGILSLIEVDKIKSQIGLNPDIGLITVDTLGTKLAHVGLPLLFAMEVGTLSVQRNEAEILESFFPLREEDRLPMIMAKIIGDEMEPTIKVKLFNLAAEYHVSTLIAFMGLSDEATTEDLAASMAQSVATIRGGLPGTGVSRQHSGMSESPSDPGIKPLQLSVQIRDCGVGLNPVNMLARGVLLLSDAHVGLKVTTNSPMRGGFELRTGSLHAIDDKELLDQDYSPSSRSSDPLKKAASMDLSKLGYQSLISVSKSVISFTADKNEDGNSVLVTQATNEVICLETCADSTQTLIQIIDGLKPPSAPERTPHYLNDPMFPQDLMDSFQGEQFEQEEPEYPEDADADEFDEGELLDAVSDDSFEMVGSFYSTSESEEDHGNRRVSVYHPAHRRGQSRQSYPPFSNASFAELNEQSRLRRKRSRLRSARESEFVVSWNSSSGRNDDAVVVPLRDCPFRLNLQVSTFVWNLFDGYGWAKTRDAISEAVEKVQEKAAQRLANRRRSQHDFDDEESEIGDTLFQSIWIAIPANSDGTDLRRGINREMDMASESTTVTTTITKASENAARRRSRQKSLKLSRSPRHKVSISISDLNGDINVLPPNLVETQSAIDIKVGMFEIFDHVPTSSWRKFVTIMHEGGTPPLNIPMAHIWIHNVKPKLELAATELVIKVDILPLRLHVDQDTLDFITRFFEFKDDTKPPSKESSPPPFIQRCEVKAVPLKLDYKPKKVDYAGLRSGRTKEFMNFVTLEDADIKLKHVTTFGITFDKLNETLNNIYVGDVVNNQLPTVLQGLAPVRPFVNVGKAALQAIFIPIQEHRKDGRIVRSVRKGIFTAANDTAAELARLTGKLAMGTGTLLSSAEALLSPTPNPSSSPLSSSPSRTISAYANQPLTVPAALRSASRHIERELAAMQDGIIAVGVDVGAQDTLGGKALAVARRAPVVVLRPIIGGTRAMGVAMLGAANALDGNAKRRALEDVSVLCF